MREKKIEEKLRDEVKKLGGVAMKFVSPGRRGVYDRLIIIPGGKIWFVEVKQPGKDLSPLQKVFRQMLINLQANNRVIDSMEKVSEFIKEVKDDDTCQCDYFKNSKLVFIKTSELNDL